MRLSAIFPPLFDKPLSGEPSETAPVWTECLLLKPRWLPQPKKGAFGSSTGKRRAERFLARGVALISPWRSAPHSSLAHYPAWAQTQIVNLAREVTKHCRPSRAGRSDKGAQKM